MLDLALTPAGHLALTEGDAPPGMALPEELIASMQEAAKQGVPDLLLHLAVLREKALPAVFVFWRTLGERYLTGLCHVPEASFEVNQPLAAPDNLAEMAEAAPPMSGGEYLQPGVLAQLWQELDEYVRGAIRQQGSLSAWLALRAPQWHGVGRVCFHLAENKRDQEYPFAFLATYAPRLSDRGRVQYQPLGRALEEYAGARNKQLLVNLLTPVQRAAERSAWVKALVDTGAVFHPLAWKPEEAYRFLRDVPRLEESGLLVRMPDWWRKRVPRVQVGVSIGKQVKSRFSAEAMLDFNVELTLAGETLTPEEWQTILQGTDGLVFLKGKWVEVDREKLKRALAQWQRVQAAAPDGISFLEGMRLLAGAPLDARSQGLWAEETAAWSDLHAGAWLEENLRQLRQPDGLSLAMPGPELRATLRPYQQAGVKWLWFLARMGLGACLADDMGLGKTIQVLALLLILKKQRPVGRTGAGQAGGKPAPALLVLPASLLANWRSEIEKFAPGLKCLYAHPSQLKPADLAKALSDTAALAGFDVVLTTYSLLTRLEGLRHPAWSLVVVDEAQAIKNPSAGQTRAVKQLKAGARIALTGTPVENRLTDLWSIFDFIAPGLLGTVKAFSTFVKRLEAREQAQYAPLRRLVAPYILRRLKTDKSVISDLPDKIEVQAFCALRKKQAALYEQSVGELTKALRNAGGIARRGVVLAFILRFKQICNHPAQWLAADEYAPEDSGKFQRLREICEEIASRQEKALIFSQFREISEPLASFLRTVFGRPGLVLHGGTDVKKRQQLVNEFQRENGPPFMVLSLKAGGTGLNLTAARHVIHFDRWWNPAVENQATDRAFRIGQKQNVMVHKFVCQGTIEEKIDALIRDKIALAGEILVEGVPKLVTEMSDGELLQLVRLDLNRVAED